MLEVKLSVFPSPKQWAIAVHGTRNAYESWHRSDSGHASHYFLKKCDGRGPLKCEDCEYSGRTDIDHYWCWPKISDNYDDLFHLGDKDRQLLKNLCNADGGDPSHSKFLRQLPITLDIRAPEYWYRQLDTYKVGTTANSTSQMHTLIKEPFKLEDFSFDFSRTDKSTKKFCEEIIDHLNDLRTKYLQADNDTTKEVIWRQILETIPQSFNYLRTWFANYEVLRTIVRQRKKHKLQEWHTFIDWIRDNVPMAKELIFNEWPKDKEE